MSRPRELQAPPHEAILPAFLTLPAACADVRDDYVLPVIPVTRVLGGQAGDPEMQTAARRRRRAGGGGTVHRG